MFWQYHPNLPLPIVAPAVKNQATKVIKEINETNNSFVILAVRREHTNTEKYMIQYVLSFLLEGLFKAFFLLCVLYSHLLKGVSCVWGLDYELFTLHSTLILQNTHYLLTDPSCVVHLGPISHISLSLDNSIQIYVPQPCQIIHLLCFDICGTISNDTDLMIPSCS